MPRTVPHASADAAVSSLARAVRVVGASSSLVGHVLGHVDRLVDGVLSDSADIAREAKKLYAATLEQAAAAKQAWRATPRFARVASELTRLAAAYQLHAKKALFLSPE